MLFLSGFELYSRWVPLLLFRHNFLKVMYFCPFSLNSGSRE